MTMTLNLQKGNLEEHTDVVHYVLKVRAQRFKSLAEVCAHSEQHLKMVKCMGLNPYKVVEIWKIFRPK